MSESETEVGDTPTTRAEANSRRIERVEDDIEAYFERVEELLEEQHREIRRLENRVARLELYIGEFGAGEDDT